MAQPGVQDWVGGPASTLPGARGSGKALSAWERRGAAELVAARWVSSRHLQLTGASHWRSARLGCSHVTIQVPPATHTSPPAPPGLDPFHLAAMEQLTATCKSVVIAAALLRGRIGVREAFTASRLEEDIQMEEWGKVRAREGCVWWRGERG